MARVQPTDVAAALALALMLAAFLIVGTMDARMAERQARYQEPLWEAARIECMERAGAND